MHMHTPSSLSCCIKAVHSPTIDFQCSSEPISACNWHDKQGNPISSEQTAEKNSSPSHSASIYIHDKNEQNPIDRKRVVQDLCMLYQAWEETESKEWIESRRRSMANDKRAMLWWEGWKAKAERGRLKKRSKDPVFFFGRLSACLLTLFPSLCPINSLSLQIESYCVGGLWIILRKNPQGDKLWSTWGTERNKSTWNAIHDAN